MVLRQRHRRLRHEHHRRGQGLPGQARDRGHRLRRPAHPEPARGDDPHAHRRRARQQAAREHLHQRPARPALHHRAGHVHRQVQQHRSAGWSTARCCGRWRCASVSSYTPTREGLFHVGWKSRDHVSKLYDSAMPFAMFFSGGQAVHYSSDFAARGYCRRLARVRERARPRGHPVALRPGGASATRSSSTGRDRSGRPGPTGRGAPRTAYFAVSSPSPTSDAARPPARRAHRRGGCAGGPARATCWTCCPPTTRSPGCVAARAWSPGAWPPAASPPGPTGSPTPVDWWRSVSRRGRGARRGGCARHRPDQLRQLRLRRRSRRQRAGGPPRRGRHPQGPLVGHGHRHRRAHAAPRPGRPAGRPGAAATSPSPTAP